MSFVCPSRPFGDCFCRLQWWASVVQFLQQSSIVDAERNSREAMQVRRITTALGFLSYGAFFVFLPNLMDYDDYGNSFTHTDRSDEIPIIVSRYFMADRSLIYMT